MLASQVCINMVTCLEFFSWLAFWSLFYIVFGYISLLWVQGHCE